MATGQTYNWMMIIRQNTRILTVINGEMGKLNTRRSIFCMKNNQDNWLNLRHTLGKGQGFYKFSAFRYVRIMMIMRQYDVQTIIKYKHRGVCLLCRIYFVFLPMSWHDTQESSIHCNSAISYLWKWTTSNPWTYNPPKHFKHKLTLHWEPCIRHSHSCVVLEFLLHFVLSLGP